MKVPPRFELGSLDSKSRVLTITPWDPLLLILTLNLLSTVAVCVRTMHVSLSDSLDILKKLTFFYSSLPNSTCWAIIGNSQGIPSLCFCPWFSLFPTPVPWLPSFSCFSFVPPPPSYCSSLSFSTYTRHPLISI